MIIALTYSDILVWLSLMVLLTALAAIILLPEYGPMPIALNRKRILRFAEAVGLLFAILFSLGILRVLS